MVPLTENIFSSLSSKPIDNITKSMKQIETLGPNVFFKT